MLSLEKEKLCRSDLQSENDNRETVSKELAGIYWIIDLKESI